MQCQRLNKFSNVRKMERKKKKGIEKYDLLNAIPTLLYARICTKAKEKVYSLMPDCRSAC